MEVGGAPTAIAPPTSTTAVSTICGRVPCWGEQHVPLAGVHGGPVAWRLQGGAAHIEIHSKILKDHRLWGEEGFQGREGERERKSHIKQNSKHLPMPGVRMAGARRPLEAGDQFT